MFQDQPANAARLEDAGVALGLNIYTFTPEEVYQKLVLLLTQKRFAENAKWLKKVQQLSDGASRAADWIEYALKVGWKHLIPLDEELGFIVGNSYDIKAAALLIVMLVAYLFLKIMKHFLYQKQKRE
jgi:hypothetical protein